MHGLLNWTAAKSALEWSGNTAEPHPGCFEVYVAWVTIRAYGAIGVNRDSNERDPKHPGYIDPYKSNKKEKQQKRKATRHKTKTTSQRSDHLNVRFPFLSLDHVFVTHTKQLDTDENFRTQPICNVRARAPDKLNTGNKILDTINTPHCFLLSAPISFHMKCIAVGALV